MLFRSKREKKKAPQPLGGRLLNIAAILLVGGMVYYQSKQSASSIDTPTPAAVAPDALTIRYFEAEQKNAFAVLSGLGAQGNVAWSDITPGSGAVALCGAKASAHLQWLEAMRDKPVTALEGQLPHDWEATLGAGTRPLDALMQSLVLGQRVGGTREVRLPLSAIYKALDPAHAAESRLPHDRLVRLRATLQEAAPPPAIDQPLSIVETQAGNTDQRAACGQKIALGLRLWNADGTPISTLKDYPPVEGDETRLTRRVTARLGDGVLPQGIARAAEGMGTGATRVLLIPPAWQADGEQSMQGMGRMFDQPPQTALVQMTLLEVGDTVADASPMTEIQTTPNPAAPPCCGPGSKPADAPQADLRDTAPLLQESSSPSSTTETPAP